MPQLGDCESRVTVASLLSELERARFYGSLEVKFEAGRVVLIRKTETLKPNCDHRITRGRQHDRFEQHPSR